MNGKLLNTSGIILILCTIMIVITQLMESISITRIISTSIFVVVPTGPSTTTTITTTSTSGTNNQLSNNNQQYNVISINDDENELEEENEDNESNTIIDEKQESHKSTSITLSSLTNTIASTSDISHQQQNRTLVIVLGNVRGGVPAWKSMCQHVLDANMADLALLIGEGRPNEPQETTLLHKRAKYIWTVPEYDDWADAMEDIPNKPSDWRERLFSMTDPSRVGNILLGAAYNISGSGALVFMFRFYLSEKLIEYNLLSQYNRFVVTRSDHYYLCVHDLNQLSNDYLWVPTGSDYFGICDRHFIANNETILSALDILPPLVRQPEAYKEQLTTYPYNTERFLLLRWEESGLSNSIRRFDRNMFLVAGNSDDTRWKPKGRYIQSLDVYLKYSQEYLESRQTCNRRNRLKERQQKMSKRSKSVKM